MMQVSLNTQNCNNANFKSLRVDGGRMLSRAIGSDGYDIERNILQNLKANDSFKKLCKKFDVYVSILPYCEPAKLLSLEIFVKERLKGFCGFFKGKNIVPVGGFIANEPKAKITQMADSITKKYINAEKGLESDINKFLSAN